MNTDGMFKVYREIVEERMRSIQAFAKDHAIDIEKANKENTINEWCAYATYYAGRATSHRIYNHSHNIGNFRSNMIKLANIAIAAVQAVDNGDVARHELGVE